MAVTVTTAEEDVEICSFAEVEEACTSLIFASGLPEHHYLETLAAIGDEIIRDFQVYLFETHGPYRELSDPSIDYELSFFSASYNSSSNSIYDFVVLSSRTQVKPFGILVLRDGKVLSEIGVSFGYSDYAVIETSQSFYFLLRDRFSQNIVRAEIE